MRFAQFNRLNALDYSGTEAVNTICSNLSFSGRHVRKIVITSCSSGDGKSYMAVQIAYNLSQRGKRVILVDADLRKSNLVSRYGITTTGEMAGLVHFLAGYNGLEDVVYRTNMENFHLIPVGRDIANPIPLLDSPAFSELLDFLAQKYDLVLLDAPPVGVVIDAAEIARSCDGVVFVAKHGHTHRKEMITAKQQMEQAGCPILGCVLNDVTFDSISAKKYYNKSYYSHYGNYYRKEYRKEYRRD